MVRVLHNGPRYFIMVSSGIIQIIIIIYMRLLETF